MERNASRAAVTLALLLAGVITTNAQRDYQDQSPDLIRFLTTKPWASGGRNRWDDGQQFDVDITDRFGTEKQWRIKPKIIYHTNDDDSIDSLLKAGSTKRSALATALNARMRRQQEPPAALEVLTGMGTFLDTIRGNLENLATMSPQERAKLFAVSPSVVSSSGEGATSTGGGGIGMRRLHALRPLRPPGNIRWACITIPKKCRTYNRRSFEETNGAYPGANNHDPGLLWTWLGRRRR